MLLFYKNKGILILVYVFSCVFGTFLIIGWLHRNVGGIFSKIDIYTGAGIGLLLAALWTHLTKDDYYKDSEGNKVMMDMENSFFFISMKIWSFIFLAAGLIFLGNLLFHYFPAM